MSNDYEETYFDEPAPPPRQPGGSKRPRGSRGVRLSPAWIVAAVVVIVAIGVVVYFAAFRGSSNKTVTGPTNNAKTGQYKVGYPKDWTIVDPNTVAPGENAFAAFRQKARKGIVVMRLEPSPKTINRVYVNKLRYQLGHQSSDFRFLSSHPLQLHNGEALDFTYERTTLHQVRNVVILPVGRVSIVMATIAPIGDTATANEISGIVNSFQLTS
ncbi:MAG: hypothetical protein ACRDLM_11150 [Gaiellaceae bacterium]